jgi:putative peptide zinc metalloprotease protein
VDTLRSGPSRPKLRDDLEIMRGMNDLPLIFDPVSGVYHRVSKSGEAMLQHLDGSRSLDDLVSAVTVDEAARPRVRTQLETFLQSLNESGLLVGSTSERPVNKDARVRRSMLMPRVVVSRSLPKLLELPARLFRNRYRALLLSVFPALAIAGFTHGFVTLFQYGLPNMAQVGLPLLSAVFIQLVLILFHETAHALVAQIYKAPVRGLGFALLFYFMPVAYVDRTDAYRLKTKSSRAAIAVAGMVSDGIFTGIIGLVAVTSTGFVHHVTVVLLALQFIGLLVNLNPLLPGDGYSALESVTGLVDVRGRSMTVLKCKLLMQPLPAYLASLPQSSIRAYLIYGTICVVYIVVLAVVTVFNILGSFRAAMTGTWL